MKYISILTSTLLMTSIAMAKEAKINGNLVKLGSYETFVEGGSEIVAYDKRSKRSI